MVLQFGTGEPVSSTFGPFYFWGISAPIIESNQFGSAWMVIVSLLTRNSTGVSKIVAWIKSEKNPILGCICWEMIKSSNFLNRKFHKKQSSIVNWICRNSRDDICLAHILISTHSTFYPCTMRTILIASQQCILLASSRMRQKYGFSLSWNKRGRQRILQIF